MGPNRKSRLSRFVDDLRSISAEATDPRAVIGRVRPLAQQLALGKTWLEKRHYDCDAEQGFGVHLLHEEPDHALAVFAVAWLPGRGALPHDHGTWAVVAGVDGPEKNTFWKRLDDGSRPGYAKLAKEFDRVFGPGEVVLLLPGEIHSVLNETDAVTVSLHVYGRHLNYVTRSEFDPDTNSARPLLSRRIMAT
jgi:predicted metal-dependent enzyme (double-stranded beta helix superfamily)